MESDMTLDPLLRADAAIQVHVAAALVAVVLTLAIFSLRRGTVVHRMLGRVWVAAMAVLALSSFWITNFRWIGPFSPIHLLSVYVLVHLVLAVHAARRGDIATHRRSMKNMTFGALVVAGAFTLLPGRIMFRVISGG